MFSNLLDSAQRERDRARVQGACLKVDQIEPGNLSLPYVVKRRRSVVTDGLRCTMHRRLTAQLCMDDGLRTAGRVEACKVEQRA